MQIQCEFKTNNDMKDKEKKVLKRFLEIRCKTINEINIDSYLYLYYRWKNIYLKITFYA